MVVEWQEAGVAQKHNVIKGTKLTVAKQVVLRRNKEYDIAYIQNHRVEVERKSVMNRLQHTIICLCYSTS